MILEGTRRYPRLRSIGAILLGYLTMNVLMIGALFGIGAFWPDVLATDTNERIVMSRRILLLINTLAQATIGGYITATAAKRREFLHAGGVIGLILLFGILSLFPLETLVHPIWYIAATIASGAAGVLLGALIRVIHRRSRHEDIGGGEPQSYHPAFREGPQT